MKEKQIIRQDRWACVRQTDRVRVHCVVSLVSPWKTSQSMAFPYGHEKTRHHLANGCVRSTQHEADWLHSFPTSNDDLLQRARVNVFLLCP